MANNIDNVTYNISIQAEEAVKQLEALNVQTASWDAKISAVTAKVHELSATWGTSFQATSGILKNADKEMQDAGTSAGVFGQQVTDSATGAKKSLSDIGFRQVAQDAEDAAPRAVRSLDAIRIALGAITAMVVFQVVQAFQQFFTMAITNARQLEATLYNVVNAERIMSQQGIEIAPKDMQEMIDNLQKLVPMLSQLDATKAVGNLALFTKDLGYTKDQINSLAEAIGVLYVRNRSLGLSFEQVQSQVQTGLLTGRAQGIRDLGVSISESAIETEALRLKLVDTDKAFKALSGDAQTQIKAQAMLSIITRSTADEQKHLGDYMETTDAKMDKAKASISNLATAIGGALAPMLGFFADSINAATNIFQQDMQNWAKIAAGAAANIIATFEVMQGVLSGKINLSDIRKAWDDLSSSIRDSLEKQFGVITGLASAEDTATGSTKDLTSSLVDMSKVDLSSLNNSLQSLQDRLNDLNRNFAQKNQNYLDEFNTKMDRMQQDYQISVQQTIQEFNNRRADLEAQYRNAQLEAEAKYQEQMRELRTKYLFDLEDALRNRDARQVLRLQAQYKMDKDNLTANFNLENAARARQYKLELAQLARQEAQKLAEMAAAEALKEQRAREDFAREQAQRQQEYQNQLDDLKRSWDEKLAEEAQKIADEYGIRGKGVDDIKKLLEQYYGKDGVFDGLYQYSYDSLVSKGNDMLAEMANIVAQYQALANMIGSGIPGSIPPGYTNRGQWNQNQNPPIDNGGRGHRDRQKARGGIEFAASATDVTFGEAGPELAMFLPLGQSLASVPNNLPPMAPQGGVNGRLRLEVDMHPDLQSRIIDNTLKEAANITTHVYRGRRR